MPSLCVVHLVWSPLGITHFENFLASYQRVRSGEVHDLLIVFNGFRGEHKLADYRALLKNLDCRQLYLAQSVQDIPAYFAAAGSSDHQYFCFLNSYSVLLNDDWLMKMYAHVRREGIGVVGASGSYESAYTNQLRALSPRRSGLRYIKDTLSQRGARLRALSYRVHFPPFPNYHVRTNAFIISRRVMLGLRVGAMKGKVDAERFESGRHSLTRQIMQRGLKPLVVGRDGVAYEASKWYESCTFRSGLQHNLLVADNRTRQYAEADPQLKKLLSEYAWGQR